MSNENPNVENKTKPSTIRMSYENGCVLTKSPKKTTTNTSSVQGVETHAQNQKTSKEEKEEESTHFRSF